MTIVPNALWSWPWKPTGSMNIPLALQALLQNQVDQILRETHRRDWTDWVHEDLRGALLASRRARKQSLLKECPGMLSGLGAIHLNDDAWTPLYVLSIAIPRSALAETPHATDLRVLNVVWAHAPSGVLSITLFNNHLDAQSTLQHFITDGLSTKRLSEWTLGRKGGGFLRAARALMTELHRPARNTTSGQPTRTVALRVGDSVGEFGWSAPRDGQRELMLRQYELRPLSLASVESVPGIPSNHLTTFDGRSLSVGATDFAFPFDQDAPRTVREFSKEKRVAAIYRERFVLRLSEKTCVNARATEPTHERSLVQPDQVLVVINGLEPPHTLEALFSAVWPIFPPQPLWIIPLPGRNLPGFTFYKPTDTIGGASKPRFFHRGYLIPSAPPLNKLGVNYSGDLDITDGQAISTTGTRFGVYLRHLAIVLDTAFCTMPELAVELAVDILTDTKAPPHSFGRVLSPSESVEEDGRLAYRAAFETAWRRLDPSLADPALVLYPYAVGDALEPCEEKALIERLGMRPVPVQPHVKRLLEKAGAYPRIKTYAEALLLASPGTLQQPHGTDNLRAALSMLFPTAKGDILSLRRYDYSHPHVVWDPKVEIFVMSASVACEEHQAPGDDDPCLCWVGVVLLEALASWRSKRGALDSGAHAGISDAAVVHALLQCTQPTPDRRRFTSTPSTRSSAPAEVRTPVEWDDGELEYNDPPPTPKMHQTPHALAYPSPKSPSAPRRRTRVRSSAFVITPLPPNRKAGVRVPRAGDGDGLHAGPDTPDPFAAGDKASSESISSPHDLTDLSDLIGNLHRGLDGRVRAIQTYYARERAALQDELDRAQVALAAERAEHGAVVAAKEAEHTAAIAAIEAEHAAVVAAKEEALAARELALEDKDALLRARDGVNARLREGLRSQTRRARGLEAQARRREERERRERARLHAEAETIHRRLKDMFRARSERDGSVFEEAKDDEYVVEEMTSEPVAKRMRLH